MLSARLAQPSIWYAESTRAGRKEMSVSMNIYIAHVGSQLKDQPPHGCWVSEQEAGNQPQSFSGEGTERGVWLAEGRAKAQRWESWSCMQHEGAVTKVTRGINTQLLMEKCSDRKNGENTEIRRTMLRTLGTSVVTRTTTTSRTVTWFCQFSIIR